MLVLAQQRELWSQGRYVWDSRSLKATPSLSSPSPAAPLFRYYFIARVRHLCFCSFLLSFFLLPSVTHSVGAEKTVSSPSTSASSQLYSLGVQSFPAVNSDFITSVGQRYFTCFRCSAMPTHSRKFVNHPTQSDLDTAGTQYIVRN